MKISGSAAPFVSSLLLCGLVCGVALFFLDASRAHAQGISGQQVELPRSSPLFFEDSARAVRERAQVAKAVMAAEVAPGDEVNFNAANVEFEQESNVITGTGGVLISGAGIQAQAEEGSLAMNTNDATLKGDVVFSGSQGRVVASQADVNLDTEAGSFSDARFTLEESGFIVRAGVAERLSETEYQITDGSLTSCSCEDDYLPWQVKTKRCHITQEGYAHAYDTSMELFGAPIFYTPYFGFPVKTERASGLLAPSAGYSSRSGLMLRVPAFFVLDDSSDLLLTPFVETETRAGSVVEYRQKFSRRSEIRAKAIYSNESARGDDLQGTNPDGIFDFTEDPTPWDTNRVGGYLRQSWRTQPATSEVDASVVSDIRLVSDDLFLREIEDPDIGSRQSRYTTSTVAGRLGLGEIGSFTLRGEYNQSFEVDDDQVLQRLPEAKLQFSRTLRPFGVNPLGIKLTPRLAVSSTDFVRSDGYDGWRTDVAPTVTMPLRYKNYFQSSLTAGLNQTYYNLGSQEVLNSDEVLEANQDRTVPNVSYVVGTGVERVFELEEGNWLSNIAEAGVGGRDLKLTRLKHTMEPFVSYLYVPKTAQGSLPLFDSFDRLRQRSSVTYGFSTTLLGRFVPSLVTSQDIPELTPRIEDLPAFGVEQPFEDMGLSSADAAFGNVSLRTGQIRRLALLRVRQNYDYFDDEANDERAEGTDKIRSYSDIGVDLGLYPSSYFGMLFGTNYNPDENSLSSWNLAASLTSDRGDAARARITYVDESVSQVEGNLELVLSDRLKAAYYARYDDQDQEFIETRAGVRIGSACDCWFFDVGFIDTINPDRQSVLASFTFTGLGAIGQDFLVADRNPQG